MKFEYLTPEAENMYLQVAYAAQGVLTPDDGKPYQPRLDEMAADIERYMKEDDRDPDDPVAFNLMKALLGQSLVWCCGYRWAKNPFQMAYSSDVVVSPDERYYLNPLDVLVGFDASGEPDLKQLVLDIVNWNLPECPLGKTMEIPE
ncbi:MAG: hypothetical protein EOP85_17320 [Verrucomicrobiaceae bacterium]|nr:MAG: hypothetical protein EOP85_17320 [Verrucomicrobiaceae bacterium]